MYNMPIATMDVPLPHKCILLMMVIILCSVITKIITIIIPMREVGKKKTILHF